MKVIKKFQTIILSVLSAYKILLLKDKQRTDALLPVIDFLIIICLREKNGKREFLTAEIHKAKTGSFIGTKSDSLIYEWLKDRVRNQERLLSSTFP